MCHITFPVRGTLIRRRMNINPTYPLCLKDIESIDHLFKDCCVSGKYEI